MPQTKTVYYWKVRSGCELNFRVSFNFQDVVEANKKHKYSKAQRLKV